MRGWMMGVAIAALGVPGPLAAPQRWQGREDDSPTLYFFFAPAAPGSVEGAKRAVLFIKEAKGRVRLRPVLLVQDFKGIGKLEESSPFYKTLKELQSLGTLNMPLFDEEGLGLALRWEIRSVPAFVLVSRGNAHRALGPRVNLEELLECDR